MDWLLSALVPIAVIAGLVLFVWQLNRGGTILQRWAARNGYRIIDAKSRWVMRGPYWLTTSRGQQVFRVTVEDQAGRLRKGYVRVGGYWLGIWSDRADVHWDAEPPAQRGFPVIVNGEQPPDPDAERNG